MPRLHHTKTRTGCQRCKVRKVKCDELRPRCSACTRHNVDCFYPEVPPRAVRQQPLPGFQDISSGYGSPSVSGNVGLDPMLEIRLMHEWTAYVCETFTTAWEFWKYQVPLIALDCRYLLDSIMCLSAMHLSRQMPKRWLPLEGRMASLSEDSSLANAPGSHLPHDNTRWSLPDGVDRTELDGYAPKAEPDYLIAKRRQDMLQIAQSYFDRAVDGHRAAVLNMTPENAEAVYCASVCISWAALFHLSEESDDPAMPCNDPVQWIRLSRGTRAIVNRWQEFVGHEWLMRSGGHYGKPDLIDQAEIFRRSHAAPFEKLITWAQDYERITDEDREAYTKALSYIGLMYKGITEGFDEPRATCRRIMAMPSICPGRFVEMVELSQPRALAIMMHVFACMKLIADKIGWFNGIAERQVPMLYERLPNAWREVVQWPLRVAGGDVSSTPYETEVAIEDISV